MLAENVLVLQVSTFEEAGRETNMHGVVNGLFSSCKWFQSVHLGKNRSQIPFRDASY
jgi:hypothetical protein